jgi:hypothetical protein
MAAREDAYTTEVKYIVAAPALLTIYLLAFPVGSTTGVDRFSGARPHLLDLFQVECGTTRRHGQIIDQQFLIRLG